MAPISPITMHLIPLVGFLIFGVFAAYYVYKWFTYDDKGQPDLAMGLDITGLEYRKKAFVCAVIALIMLIALLLV